MSEPERFEALFPLMRGRQTITSIQHTFNAVDYASAQGLPVGVDALFVAPGHPVKAIDYGDGLVIPTQPLDKAKATELAGIQMHRLLTVPPGLRTALEEVMVRRLFALTNHNELLCEVIAETLYKTLGGIALVAGTNKGIKVASDYCDQLRAIGNEID